MYNRGRLPCIFVVDYQLYLYITMYIRGKITMYIRGKITMYINGRLC